jgi:hypothetical protein
MSSAKSMAANNNELLNEFVRTRAIFLRQERNGGADFDTRKAARTAEEAIENAGLNGASEYVAAVEKAASKADEPG